jgi:hypothetical protein
MGSRATQPGEVVQRPAVRGERRFARAASRNELDAPVARPSQRAVESCWVTGAVCRGRTLPCGSTSTCTSSRSTACTCATPDALAQVRRAFGAGSGRTCSTSYAVPPSALTSSCARAAEASSPKAAREAVSLHHPPNCRAKPDRAARRRPARALVQSTPRKDGTRAARGARRSEDHLLLVAARRWHGELRQDEEFAVLSAPG